MDELIRRLPVWGKWLRGVHWALALSTLLLLISGWLMIKLPQQSELYTDLHYLASSLFIAALAIRFWLLGFGKSHEQWIALVPDLHRLRQAGQVVAFYLSLGRSPLPKWYAHNPLWGPIYLLFFLLALLQVISGLFLLSDTTLVGSLSIRSLHQLGSTLLLWFCVLHLVATFTHDVANKSADVSAMINGFRIFFVKQQEEQNLTSPGISLDALKKELPSQRKDR